MACSGRKKEVDIRPEQKWDFISLNDFKSTSCFAPLAYGYLWISLVISIAVYAVDTFTAVNLLAFDKWSGEIKPFIPIYISKWIFSACIIASWVNLGFEYIRALRVMRRGAVAESYLDSLAVRLQCIRMGQQGRGWRRFLVFAELTKSKKGTEYVALFTFFSFQAWIRIIFCQGPRQVVNAITLYSVFKAKLDPTGATDVGSTILTIFKKIGFLAQSDHQQAAILSGMVFTLIIWVFGALSLLLAMLFYILFLWHYIPNADGGLAGYCERKINSRLAKIVSVKVNKAIQDEERKRLKADAKAVKKGETPLYGRQATIPTLLDAKDEDKLPSMPMLNRNDTMSTLPLYTSRPGTPSSAVPSYELDQFDQKRPLPSRTVTNSSNTSFASSAGLVGNASSMGMGYGRSASPAPSLPSLDANGLPMAPQRTMTSNSNNSSWARAPPTGPPRLGTPGSLQDLRGYTASPVSYIDSPQQSQSPLGGPRRQESVDQYGRPLPRAIGELRSNTPSGPPPPPSSVGRRTPFEGAGANPYNGGNQYPNGGRASPAPSQRGSPTGGPPPMGPSGAYQPGMRSASAAPGPMQSVGLYGPPGGQGQQQYRNLTEPGMMGGQRGPPQGQQGDYFGGGGPQRPGTAGSMRGSPGMGPGMPSPGQYRR